MNNPFEEKRKKLQKEVEIAESLLKHNLHNTSPTNYLDSDHIAYQLTQIPQKPIVQLDLLTRNFLSEDNLIRKGLRYASSVIKGFAFIRGVLQETTSPTSVNV